MMCGLARSLPARARFRRRNDWHAYNWLISSKQRDRISAQQSQPAHASAAALRHWIYRGAHICLMQESDTMSELRPATPTRASTAAGLNDIHIFD
jgi:hypothetical protein